MIQKKKFIPFLIWKIAVKINISWIEHVVVLKQHLNVKKSVPMTTISYSCIHNWRDFLYDFAFFFYIIYDKSTSTVTKAIVNFLSRFFFHLSSFNILKENKNKNEEQFFVLNFDCLCLSEYFCFFIFSVAYKSLQMRRI